MTKIELDVLVNMLSRVLYLIKRTLPNERNAQLDAIMTQLAIAIKPYYEELVRIQERQ